MSGLEYILGSPISRFSDDQLPTIKDVLRFYSSNWGKKVSDSTKEAYVAKELIKVYQEAGLPVLNEKSIKDRIKKHVLELKLVLKFKSKVKTTANIQTEISFRSKLEETFRIQSSATCQTSNDQIASTNNGNVDEITSEIYLDDGIFSCSLNIIFQNGICINVHNSNHYNKLHFTKNLCSFESM